VPDPEPPSARIGAPLPRADEARIDPRKIRDYALNPDHPHGRDKAQVFNSALGITAADWQYLYDVVLEGLPGQLVTASRETGDYCTWEVRMPINGLGAQSGRSLQLITAWSIIDGVPVLATIRVAPKRGR
jgi:hypothetical protein